MMLDDDSIAFKCFVSFVAGQEKTVVVIGYGYRGSESDFSMVYD